jgi:hypothetical protein
MASIEYGQKEAMSRTLTFHVVRTLMSLFLLSAGLSSAAETETTASIRLGDGHGSGCTIVYPANEELSAHTADKLAQTIQIHAGWRPTVAADEKHVDGGGSLVVIDGTPDHRLAAQFGQPISIASDREEAFVLRTTSSNDRPLVIVAGMTAKGAKYAAQELMLRQLDFGPEGLVTMPRIDIEREPHIAIRSMALFNMWMFDGLPMDQVGSFNIESWPAEKIERYIDLIDMLGFNAIETHDRFSDYTYEKVYGCSRAEWRQKVIRMCKRAHRNGQKVFLRAWGNAVTSPGRNAEALEKCDEFCVNIPEERQRFEKELLHYLVDHYGPHIDHFIGHWGDAGGCPRCRKNKREGKPYKCTFKTALELQMEYHNALKKVNPNIETTFSTWWIDKAWPTCRDRPNDPTLFPEILSREVGVAIHTRYDGNTLEYDKIKKAGYRPAVWVWYMVDNENQPSMHIHLHKNLADYYQRLPRDLWWHTAERHAHGSPNIANFYVAGRLLWEPELNIDDLVSEYVALAFGEENAQAIEDAYLTIEQIRCLRARAKDQREDPEYYHKIMHMYHNYGWCHFGANRHPHDDLKQAEEALKGLESVRFNAAQRPRLPLVIDRDEIVRQLQANLETLRQVSYYQAMLLPAVREAMETGNMKTARKLIDQLDQETKDWPNSLFSILESQIRKFISIYKDLMLVDGLLADGNQDAVADAAKKVDELTKTHKKSTWTHPYLRGQENIETEAFLKKYQTRCEDLRTEGLQAE